MLFCVTTALSCLLINIPFLPVLFFGRFLGGFSAAIQTTTLESWIVAAANALNLSSKNLSNILGHAMLVNSIVATVAGVASDKLVEWQGTFNSPFIAGSILLAAALVLVAQTWSENYGSRAGPTSGVFALHHLHEAWTSIYTGELSRIPSSRLCSPLFLS